MSHYGPREHGEHIETNELHETAVFTDEQGMSYIYGTEEITMFFEDENEGYLTMMRFPKNSIFQHPNGNFYVLQDFSTEGITINNFFSTAESAQCDVDFLRDLKPLEKLDQNYWNVLFYATRIIHTKKDVDEVWEITGITPEYVSLKAGEHEFKITHEGLQNGDNYRFLGHESPFIVEPEIKKKGEGLKADHAYYDEQGNFYVLQDNEEDSSTSVKLLNPRRNIKRVFSSGDLIMKENGHIYQLTDIDHQGFDQVDIWDNDVGPSTFETLSDAIVFKDIDDLGYYHKIGTGEWIINNDSGEVFEVFDQNMNGVFLVKPGGSPNPLFVEHETLKNGIEYRFTPNQRQESSYRIEYYRRSTRLKGNHPLGIPEVDGRFLELNKDYVRLLQTCRWIIDSKTLQIMMMTSAWDEEGIVVQTDEPGFPGGVLDTVSHKELMSGERYQFVQDPNVIHALISGKFENEDVNFFRNPNKLNEPLRDLKVIRTLIGDLTNNVTPSKVTESTPVSPGNIEPSNKDHQDIA